ncbi:MAG: diguanylate cyclase [Desulfobacteraceae bacterium]
MDHLLSHETRVQQEIAITNELGSLRGRIEKLLNKNLFLLYSMAAYLSIEEDISADKFDPLAKEILSHSDSLKNIAIAPDFIIKYVYPLAGNEEVIGLNYRKVPGQWPQALAAKETGHMIVAGPVSLVQGGRGLVARIPVFIGENNKFWGLVSSVIDFDKLLKQVELDQISNHLQLAIRGKDSKGEKGEVFWGDAALFEQDADVLTMPISLPFGFWQMAARPHWEWEYHYNPWVIHTSILLIAVLGCFGAISLNRSRLALIEGEKRLKSMSDASHDALIMIDSNSGIILWNPAAEVMFGYTKTEALGKNLHDLIAKSKDAQKARIGMQKFAKTGEGPVLSSVMEMEAIHKSGKVFPVERSVAPFQFNGKWYAIGSVRDITVRKEFEKQLTELARIDSLTGISNRRYFMEEAEKQLQQAIRYKKNFSVMMFDLDHFKCINDTYGHDVGDKVLQSAAETVKSILRNTDIIGRIGGEEFAVAMPETNLALAEQAAERVRLNLMKKAVQTQNETIHFTVSIGICQLTSPETTLDQLMKKADESLYTAKRNGRNRTISTA